MSEVTLHGQEVKFGDTVHDVLLGKGSVVQHGKIQSVGWPSLVGVQFESLIKDDIVYFLDSGAEHCDGEPIGAPRLYWQPIDPAAIEAAKVKPKEPEYEWQWLLKSTNGSFETSPFGKTEGDALAVWRGQKWEVVYRIEESKRELKP